MTYTLPPPLACTILFVAFVLVLLPQTGGYWSKGMSDYEPRYWHAIAAGAMVWGAILLITTAVVMVAWAFLSVLDWLGAV